MSPRSYTLREVTRQFTRLPADLVELSRVAEPAAARAAGSLRSLERLVLLGSGDSLHAALSAAPLLARAGVECAVLPAATFLQSPPWPEAEARTTAVVGVSASGGNPTVVSAVAGARRHARATVAVTCAAGSPLARAAETSVIVDPRASEPSPGIRTYQAVLLALLHLGAAVCRSPAHRGGGGRPADVVAHTAALGDPETIARAQSATIEGARLAAGPVAALLAPVPVVLVVAGPATSGSARYLAAKFTETAGVPAMAVDPEDWWHVHRFGHDPAHPVVFFVPPGPDRGAALETARRTARSRRLVVVAGAADAEAREVAAVTVPVAEHVAEVARPLVDSAVSGPLAAELARVLHRLPFGRQ
ncbi:SIS domain-containing protein [Actinacidiphila yeochonensis]|uniref:SIS domain-containing protein n=1 Tax=Actinacidiphila yeochonensis TaxID=89050 RepID=UPI000562B762|nr:SIS domain-containing protein [Actinacidiphila yeochonensis]